MTVKKKLKPTKQILDLAAAANSAVLAMPTDWEIRYRLHEALFLLGQRYSLGNYVRRAGLKTDGTKAREATE